MSAIEKTLKTYADFELAFVWLYNSDGFTERSRNIVSNEIRSRNLTDEDLNNLVKKKLAIVVKNHNFSICPRCTSTKILNTRDMVRNRAESSNAIDGRPPKYENKYYCSICGWDFTKNKTLYDHIKNFKIYFFVFAIIIFISFIISLIMNFVDRLK